MSRVRVHCFSVSLDGFATGVGQARDAPFGHAGGRLLEWFAATQAFHRIHGELGGSTGTDDAFAAGWEAGIGADIMGRSMFGPQSAPWADFEWGGGTSPVPQSGVRPDPLPAALNRDAGWDDLPLHQRES